MSRLIVKGLPDKITETKVRKLFEQFGTVTDVSLKYTPDGLFRRFGFIGFESEESCRKAISKLNNSNLQSSTIVVEQCKPFTSETKPKPWSKPIKQNNKQTLKDESSDSHFLDFKNKDNIEFKTEAKSDENSKIDQFLSSYKEDKKLSLIFRGLPGSLKQKNFTEWLYPIRTKSIEFLRANEETIAVVGFNRPPDLRRALQKNDQFLGGYKIKVTKFSTAAKNSFNSSEFDEKSEKEKKAIIDTISRTGRLFLRNLAYICTDDHLSDLFKSYGELEDLQCILDRSTGKCKGFAIVSFASKEKALEAYNDLDGTIFMGRMMHILAGQEKPEEKEANLVKLGQRKGLSQFQNEKLSQQKALASTGKSHTWNPLFMGANAAAESLAARMDVDKFDVVAERGANSAGIRIAMAETKLVKETREFLLANGICLEETFAGKRSTTTIIVKNLISAADMEEELRKKFSRFGEIKKLTVPSAGGLCAIVEMCSKIVAKKAFEGLAYTSLKKGEQPLYLEWALMAEKSSKKEIEVKEEEEVKPAKKVEDEEKETKKQTKLLVRNVPFQTSLEELNQLFSAFGELKDIRLPRKVGEVGHKGFCFVDFASGADARRAYDSLMLSTHLYGRRLVLEWAKQEETIDELRVKSASKRRHKDGKHKASKRQLREAMDNNEIDSD